MSILSVKAAVRQCIIAVNLMQISLGHYYYLIVPLVKNNFYNH